MCVSSKLSCNSKYYSIASHVFSAFRVSDAGGKMQFSKVKSGAVGKADLKTQVDITFCSAAIKQWLHVQHGSHMIGINMRFIGKSISLYKYFFFHLTTYNASMSISG